MCAVIPAAARERQAVALGQSLRQAAGVIQLPDAGRAAARLLAPRRLGRDRGAARRASPWRAKTDAPRRADHDADARRSAALPRMPAAGVGARPAADARRRRRRGRGRGRPARAREPGRRARPDVAPAARAVRARDRRRRHRRRARWRTATTPTIARPAARRHAAVRVVRRRRARPAPRRCCGRGARGCARRWTGACRPGWRRSGTAPRPSIAATSQIAPAIPLSVPLPDGPRDDLAARPERAADARSMAMPMAVTLVTADARRGLPERDRLRAWLTHLALAASGARRRPPVRRRSCSAANRDGEPAQVDRGGVRADRRRRTRRALLAGAGGRSAGRRAPLPDAVRGRLHLEAPPAQGSSR